MSTTPDPLRVGGGVSYYISGLSNGGRAYVVTAVTSTKTASVTTPTAGGDIDGVAYEVDMADGDSWVRGTPAVPGLPAQLEAGGSISAGDDLQVQGDGQVVTASGGTVVARAVEGASAGQHFWAVFT